jgi:hypothetical protein
MRNKFRDVRKRQIRLSVFKAVLLGPISINKARIRLQSLSPNPGLNLQDQSLTGPFEKDIVNEFSLRYQFNPIMINGNSFRNVYVFSRAGTPNKIWRNSQ